MWKKYFERENRSKKNNKMEKCVLCECITDVKKDIDINERKYYVQGAGQLCSECYKEIYES